MNVRGLKMSRRDYEKLKQRLAQILFDKELSQRSVSKALNKNQNYINQVVLGYAPITFDEIYKICDLLNIEVYELFGNDFTDEEKHILNLLKALDKEEIEAVHTLLNSIQETNQMD